VLLDARPLGLTGYQAEAALRQCGITLNRNSLPFDTEPPLITSGLRLGTAAVTTLGMGTSEMDEIAAIIALVLKGVSAAETQSGRKSKKNMVLDPGVQRAAGDRVRALLTRFPVYPELDLELLESRFPGSA
jgi:glycine hydroxymethyltransferase